MRVSMSMSVHISVSLLILASIFFPPLSVEGSDVPSPGSQRSIQPMHLSKLEIISCVFPAGNNCVNLLTPFIGVMNSPEKKMGESFQVITVRNISPASIDVRISLWERKNDCWQRPFAPMDGVIGRKGFAPPGEKREGDGRTPAGIFPLGTVFGYAPSVPTKMPYRQATVDDLWIDDAQAADYNRWVRRGTTQAASFERMRRDDDLYKYGIIVEYNTNPVIKGQGSAIFFHLWKGKGLATAGCIALSEADLLSILRWLDPAAKPLVVMGPNATIGDF
jgi:L,D-peptidoglycan transpeptidase YkuD (ErfK/YbiS/YcfS/YnhG family)